MYPRTQPSLSEPVMMFPELYVLSVDMRVRRLTFDVRGLPQAGPLDGGVRRLPTEDFKKHGAQSSCQATVAGAAPVEKYSSTAESANCTGMTIGRGTSVGSPFSARKETISLHSGS